MTAQEERRIREWGEELPDEIRIGLHVTEDTRSAELNRFCMNLTRLAPKIAVFHEESDADGAPWIRVGHAIRYHAVPLNMELEPFLEALSRLQQQTSGLSLSLLDEVKKLRHPALLKLYVSPQCPVCPSIIRQIARLPAANEFIALTIIDCALFPEMAQANRIQSVPTIILDEQFRWAGPVQLEELVSIIMNRDPAALSASSLERMLVEGDAMEVAEMMLAKQDIFPQFLDLLIDKKWSVRVGAMVAMEEVADRSPELLVRVVDPLWERFHAVEDPIKDDILYILGKSGSSELAARLETILNAPYSAIVKEAAKETLQTLLEKTKPLFK